MPGQNVRENIIARASRIVVKVGTNSICNSDGRPDHKAISKLAGDITAIMRRGVEVTLVASGAIGAGLGELDLQQRPKTVPGLQAAAAVGQGQLMRMFHDAFARRKVKVAQVLLTRDAFEDRTRYLNIRNTLRSLRDFSVLPIINENDTVAVDEIRFGENDILAGMVANMIGADVLVLLTSVDGVLDEHGKVLDFIERIDAKTRGLIRTDRSSLGSGGMKSKLNAAAMVMAAGEAVVIANARTQKILQSLLDGKSLGTVFIPAKQKLSSKQRWIGQAARPVGKIVVDDGAAKALRKSGKSLLPSGVVTVVAMKKDFTKGAMVIITDRTGREIARGLTNYSSENLDAIKGLRSNQIAHALGNNEKPYDEAVHRNNMTLSK
jgi:glutamate 5-kinase